jgi:probable HAF family extracellular repeat protein
MTSTSARSGRLTRALVAATSAITLGVLAARPASAHATPGAGAPDRERATSDRGEPREIRSPGFLFVDGRFTTIQVPRARTHTYAFGINDRGLIAGGFDNPSFDGPNGRGHGIVRQRDGSFLRFDVRGAVATLATKINDRGQVVGGFNPTNVSVGAVGTKGFLRGPRGVRVINVPGSIETQALGINNVGVVVGEYVDADGVFHGFRWKDGRFTTIDGPGSLGGAVLDINDRGHLVGAYFTPRGTFRGFVLRNGRYRTFSAPFGPIDLPTDINNRGQIVGSSLSDPTGTESHGFLLRRGVGGPFARIDFPGTSQTLARGIDDRGRIVGLYGNPAAAPGAVTAQRAGQPSALLAALPLGLRVTAR